MQLKSSLTCACVALVGCNDGATPESIASLLQGEPYSRLVIEVDTHSDVVPFAGVGLELQKRLQEVLDKPGGIEVIIDEVLPERESIAPWSDSELGDLASSTETLALDGDTVRIHTLFVTGSSAGQANALGQSFGDHTLVLFKQRIVEACSGTQSSCFWAEHYVWLHEIGHLLGLVSHGTPMQNEHHDDDHPAHCTEENCVMRWGYEGAPANEVPEVLDQPDVPDRFGIECMRDLGAIREL